MKKRILLFLSLLALAILCLSFNVLATDEAVEDAAHVWEITDKDGNVTYSDDFFGGLDGVAGGDILRLLPDYIELDTIYSISHDRPFTVDLGDSTIVYPNPNITSPVLNIGGSANITFLANGANICLQLGVRSFMSVQGSANITVLGVGKGLTIYAPDAFDAGTNAVVELHRVTMVKHCANMMGMLCARGSSTVSAYDCKIISRFGWNAIYATGTGKMSLYNTTVISTDNTSAGQIDSSATLYAEGSVFSCSLKQNGKFTVGAGCYLPMTSGYDLADGVSSFDLNAATAIESLEFVTPDSGKPVSATPCSIFRYTVSLDDPTDTSVDGSVWRVDSADGGCYYTTSFYYPLLNSRAGDRLTLISDASVDVAPSAELLADSVNLGTHALTVDLPDWLTIDASAALFVTEGDTPFTLTAGGSLGLDIPLLSGTRPMTLSLDGATVNAPSIVTSSADISVHGGLLYTADDAVTTVGAADVFLDGTFILSQKSALTSGRSATLHASTVASASGDALSVLSTLTLTGDTRVSGGVTAATVNAENGVLFDTPPAEGGKFLYKTLNEPLADDRLPSVSFAYCSSTPDSISLSIGMSNDVTLYVYIPEHVYAFDALTVISVDGITYSPSVEDGVRLTVGDESFVRFSFGHVYPTDITASASVRVNVSGVELRAEFTLLDVMLASFASGEEDFKRAVATYLDLCLDAIGYDPTATHPSIDADGDVVDLNALAPYVKVGEIPVPNAPDFISTVYFDIEKCVIAVRPTEGVTLNKLTLTWDDDEIIVRAVDGVIEIPFLRLDPSESIRVFYHLGNQSKEQEIGILSLYSVVSDSPGRSTALFVKYLNYLTLISEL